MGNGGSVDDDHRERVRRETTRDDAPLYTPTEVAALAGVPGHLVESEIADGVVTARDGGRLDFASLVYLHALNHLQFKLDLHERQRLLSGIQSATTPGGVTDEIALTDLLVLRVGALVATLRAACARFFAWKNRLVSDDEVLGGDPRFPGSRLSVYQVGSMRPGRGGPERTRLVVEPLTRAYPYLTEEDLELATRYVWAYPAVRTSRAGEPAPATRAPPRWSANVVIRLLLDEALCVDLEQLRDADVDAVHVGSVGLGGATDRAVLECAWAERRILTTANITDPTRFARTTAHPGIVFLEEMMFPPVSQIVHLLAAIEVLRAALAEGQVTENRMLRVWDRSMWEWRGGRARFVDPWVVITPESRAERPGSATLTSIGQAGPADGAASPDVSRFVTIERDPRDGPETEPREAPLGLCAEQPLGGPATQGLDAHSSGCSGNATTGTTR